VTRTSLLDQREAAALRQTYTDARVMRNALRAADPDVAALLSGLQIGGDGGAVLVTASGTFSSSVDVGDDDIPRSLASGVEAGRAGRQRVSGPDGPRLVVGVPIAAADAEYYEVTSLAEIEGTLDRLGSALAVAGVVAAALGVGLGAAVSGEVLRPLHRAADVARRIVDGDLDRRLDAESDRDLAPLADAFNAMLDDLRERIRREVRFASDVTHELRGPLTVLAAAVSVVERRRDHLPAEALQAIDALETQVRSFNRLVLDLLDISRFDAGTAALDARPVPVAPLIRAVLADREPPQTDLLRMSGREHGEAVVDVDARRIQQVLANLLDNAENYAGGATAVTIDAPDGDIVRIGVEDHGPGVEPDERDAIFDRFARGSAGTSTGAPRGSGLGLALCADHVRLHGGQLRVEDVDGGGARFVVELPRRRA
jgi:signal transduction histidine kinase